MQTVGQIIRERREANGMTLAALADSVGSTKSYLSMIENHRVNNPPSRELLRSLERALRISEGELTRAADWQNTPKPVRDEMSRLSEAARRTRELAGWLRETAGRRRSGPRDLDVLFRSGELTKRIRSALMENEPGHGGIDSHVPIRYQVPLINKVAAGYPSDFTDLSYPTRVADEYVACPGLTDPQAFAARVVGESMLPDYKEGDIIVFSPGSKVTHGSDCFIRLEPNHQTTFKRVFFDQNGEKNAPKIRLQPLNPRFAPQVVSRELVAGMYKAVWRFQKLG